MSLLGAGKLDRHGEPSCIVDLLIAKVDEKSSRLITEAGSQFEGVYTKNICSKLKKHSNKERCCYPGSAIAGLEDKFTDREFCYNGEYPGGGCGYRDNAYGNEFYVVGVDGKLNRLSCDSDSLGFWVKSLYKRAKRWW